MRTLLTDVRWSRLCSLLPLQKPRTGRPSIDHRRFIEALLWLACTGSPLNGLLTAGPLDVGSSGLR